MYLLKNLRLFYAPKIHQLSHCIGIMKKEKKDLSYVVVHKAIQRFANKILYCERKCANNNQYKIWFQKMFH